MDSNLLKVFVAVAEQKSISLGAQVLGCTQSNATLRIKQLEKKLGFALFYRIPKGVSLTYEGEKLYPHAVEIVEKVDRANIEMKNVTQQELLRIGTSQANATIRLLSFIELLKKDYPTMEIELCADGTPQIVELLLNYKVDIAFVMGNPNHKDIIVLSSYEDSPYVIESKHNKSKNCLIGYRERSTHFEYLKKYYRSKGNTHFSTMIMENYEIMLGCVKLGMGKAFVSRYIVEKFGYLQDLKLTKIQGDEAHLKTHLICRSDNIPKIADYLQDLHLK